jgi:adenine-specific DNA-methyltransferase
MKYNQLYDTRSEKSLRQGYTWIETTDGRQTKLTSAQLNGFEEIPAGRRFITAPLVSQSGGEKTNFPVNLNGQIFRPSQNAYWKTNEKGMEALKKAMRLIGVQNTLAYVRYEDDFPVVAMTNFWSDTQESTFAVDKKYVVQTATKVIQRCLLMTTDPADLVLDITCGSGTTAYVAEQWGRRWITCDTSRVAITLAKKRLMTATYDYYKLAHEEQGVDGGFVYKTVPHITLKSIANNEPPARETLYDQPEIDKNKIRISGPFTVEALPAPVVLPLDEAAAMPEDYTAKQTDWRDELLATGILGRGGAKIEFSRVEPLSGTTYLQAEAETKEETPRRAVICFAGETKPLDSRMVSLALQEAEELHPAPKLIVFAAFQFDPEAAKDIDDAKWPGVTLLKVQMNTDLMTDDLKKKRSSNQSFWLVGQPDVELVQIEKGRDKGKYQIKVNGFDYYDVKSGTVISGNTGKIAMWMLDTNYDGMSVEPMQVFFPLGGGWEKLAKTLKAEINQDLIENYAGTVSVPFAVDGSAMIAVKIIDDRGIESLKVLKVGERNGKH